MVLCLTYSEKSIIVSILGIVRNMEIIVVILCIGTLTRVLITQ